MSSSMGLPRSALRHRPIYSYAEADIPAWVRASRQLGRRQRAWFHSLPGSSILLRLAARFPSASLATLVGLGMAIALLAILLAQWLGGWVSLISDDLHYGRPRTFQTDAFVGHEQTGQPSHFVALNIKGQIEVIELPGNNPAHARIFIGPRLAGSHVELVPITLQFTSSTHTRYPDMLLHIGPDTIRFRNTHTGFQLQP
ncbi:hypothetical protein [Dictyobacter aurantiacus]|uniref:Uncharacterized protein n=1 Tax=Dictyobacter aurantiacus TaxID=1936993 RepID=A0A401ZLH7_9CHLR|nr:hypothetical protein [Dictyobacter aurantiacus]GCE07727.1 hypothetical protein KDAU_50560 [Dictyobacter aurantiacus]